MPKSPRTSTPGERKALRSKAWSEETELYICKMKNGIGFWKMKVKVNANIFRLCFKTGTFLETAPNRQTGPPPTYLQLFTGLQKTPYKRSFSERGYNSSDRVWSW